MNSATGSVDFGIKVRTGTDRATLVRRTYALVFATVLVTIAGVAVGLRQPALMQWVARHPFLTFLATFAPLIAALRVRAAFPANIALVFLFALVEGLAISPIIWVQLERNAAVIGQAGLLTGSTFGVLTLYAWFSRRDFSAWGSFLTIGLWVLIATSLLNYFFGNSSSSLWLAAVTVLLFGALLIFDTWRLKNLFGPNEYVQAAVSIYLDLLNMFMGILRLFGFRSGD